MALGEEGGGGIPATMLVSPTGINNGGMAYPYPVFGGFGGGSGSGMGGFGNDGGWIVLLLIIILVAAGGWGNNGTGGGAFGGQPIVINDGGTQRGFDQAATMAGLNGIQSGIASLSTQLCGCCGDISTQLCNGFSGVNATVNSGVNTIAQQMYSGTIADLERSFAAQTANTQGMNALQAQLSQCCCDNRSATESLRYTIATEACNDRAAVTQGIQTVLDKLCSLELDNYRRENDQLRTQLNMATLAASQTAQTAQIRDGQNASVAALVNELRSSPIPSQPVFGNSPIFSCAQPINPNNSGCGCGCNGF